MEAPSANASQASYGAGGPPLVCRPTHSYIVVGNDGLPMVEELRGARATPALEQ